MPLHGSNNISSYEVTTAGTTTPRSLQERFSEVFNLRDFGATGDGTGDDGLAFQRAFDAAPDIDTSWNSMARSAKTTALYVPTPSNFYNIVSQIQIPGSKSVSIFGPGPMSSRLKWSGTGSHMVRIRKDSGWSPRPSEIRGLVFQGGCITYDQQQIIHHGIHECLFELTPAPAITTSGISVVSVKISECFFSRCSGSLYLPHNSCDHWLFEHCSSVRGAGTDVYLGTSGVTVRDCDFETRVTAFYNKPFIHMVSGGSKILHNRFGDDTDIGYAPPAVAICVGPYDGTDDTAIEYGEISSNFFGGTNNTPSATDASGAIRISAPLREMVVSNNQFLDKYAECIVDERYIREGTNKASNHANNAWANNTIARTHTPKIFSEGGSGWNIVGGTAVTSRNGLKGRGFRNLLPNTNNLILTSSWIPTNASASMDAIGPDGAVNSAFTITKLAAGSSNIRVAAGYTTVGGETLKFTARIRSGSVDRARLGLHTGAQWLTPLVTVERLDGQFRDYSVIAPNVPAGVTCGAYIFVGNDLDTSLTGSIVVHGPQLQVGVEDQPYVPNSGTLRAAAPWQALSLGNNIVGYGSAAPAAGRYELGDIWINTIPTAGGFIGWVCTAAGSPGTWKTFGAISA